MSILDGAKLADRSFVLHGFNGAKIIILAELQCSTRTATKHLQSAAYELKYSQQGTIHSLHELN